MTTRQRRGKRTSDTTATKGEEEEKAKIPSTPVDKQLEIGIARVLVSRERTIQLHTSWRGQLHRLSYLVLFVVIHGLKIPVKNCISDVALFDLTVERGGSGAASAISMVDTVWFVLKHSFCEIVGLLNAALLIYFTLLPSSAGVGDGAPLARDFSDVSYMISSILVPFQLALYFQMTKTETIESCLPSEMFSFLTEEESSEKAVRQFPVACIFHAILTVAYWFMNYGMEQCNENVDTIMVLKRQLDAAKKKKHDTLAKKAATKK